MEEYDYRLTTAGLWGQFVENDVESENEDDVENGDEDAVQNKDVDKSVVRTYCLGTDDETLCLLEGYVEHGESWKLILKLHDGTTAAIDGRLRCRSKHNILLRARCIGLQRPYQPWDVAKQQSEALFEKLGASWFEIARRLNIGQAVGSVLWQAELDGRLGRAKDEPGWSSDQIACLREILITFNVCSLPSSDCTLSSRDGR